LPIVAGAWFRHGEEAAEAAADVGKLGDKAHDTEHAAEEAARAAEDAGRAAEDVAGSAASLGLKRGVEHLETVADSLTARKRGAELAGLGKDSILYRSELGPQKGWVVGRSTKDGARGWRVDWDSVKGYHINWWDYTGGKKRASWLYGAVVISGGTWDDYIEFLRHAFGN
jgi:hypothetical protein